jgi:hypothetical protein
MTKRLTKFFDIFIVLLLAFSAGAFAMSATMFIENQTVLYLDLSDPLYAYPDLTSSEWTRVDNFNFGEMDSLSDLEAVGWYPSTPGLRNYEYWCPDMIDFSSDEYITIQAKAEENHVCSTGCCVNKETGEPIESGVFTSGIEMRTYDEEGKSVYDGYLYGFFECEVMVPTGSGMWSAFWLQADGVTKVGDKGRDGSEIDVYESSFFRDNKTKVGQAIHYDAYDYPAYRSFGKVTDVGYDLYEGWHKYALLWTDDFYVFYVDGVAVWATRYGGVSEVPQFLRLTTEIRTGVYGPYAQNIGEFDGALGERNDFKIKSVVAYTYE